VPAGRTGAFALNGKPFRVASAATAGASFSSARLIGRIFGWSFAPGTSSKGHGGYMPSIFDSRELLVWARPLESPERHS
jgi:hypothetical protein